MQSSTTNRIEEATTAKTVAIPLAEIVVPSNRLRALRPDHVEQLAESMRLRGLLEPIRVRRNGGPYRLTAGWHRLKAAELLGWTTITAIVDEGMSAEEGRLVEIDENLIRADLRPAERAAHFAARKQIYEKLYPRTKHGGDPKSAEGKSSRQNGDLKRFTEDTAKKTGKSERSVQREVERGEKIADVAELAGTSLDHGDELDAMAKLPRREQRELTARAKKGEKVSAKSRVKQVARQERERQLGTKLRALPDKKYGVILADPEWHDEVWSEATGMDRHAANHYPTSAEEIIASRPVASIAADDCVLWLWTTNQHLRIAINVMEAWGFEYKSNYCWGKDRKSLGRWQRGKHELLLIGTRGEPPCPAPGTQRDSLINVAKGEHSAKPEIFLEMIEEYFPTLPKIELNRRGPPRPGWDAWGNQAEPANEQVMAAAVTLDSTQAATDIDGYPIMPAWMVRNQ